MRDLTILSRTFAHHGQAIEVFFSDVAFFNATVAAKPFGKSPKDWLKTKEAQEYIEALGRIVLTEQNQLVIVRQGGVPGEQGTWLHPKLAVAFARWLSADFAVWCDQQIESILRERASLATVTPAELILQQAQLLVAHEHRLERLERRVELLDSDTGYCTVLAYFRRRGLKPPPISTANRIGQEATRLARENGIRLGKVPDERFGTVNSYPVSLLDEVVTALVQVETKH